MSTSDEFRKTQQKLTEAMEKAPSGNHVVVLERGKMSLWTWEGFLDQVMDDQEIEGFKTYDDLVKAGADGIYGMDANGEDMMCWSPDGLRSYLEKTARVPGYYMDTEDHRFDFMNNHYDPEEAEERQFMEWTREEFVKDAQKALSQKPTFPH
jgi:hypothetical protein